MYYCGKLQGWGCDHCENEVLIDNYMETNYEQEKYENEKC
jgi:hypothetical protein